MAASDKQIDWNWRKKHRTLRSFYETHFVKPYYDLEPYQYTIDPMESRDKVEAYDTARQEQEILRCAKDFNYFCHKYVRIVHPKHGIMPFVMYKYQRRVIADYDKNRFCLISKFRQGGLTTVSVLWGMWRCLFHMNETIMVVSKTDREAIASGEIVKQALAELPGWLKPDLSKNNDRQKVFDDTNSKLFFYSPNAVRGRSPTYIIIDEAAFIVNMNELWKAILPSISAGGKVFVISTVNGVSGDGEWYYEMYMGATSNPPKNKFQTIDLDYWEHPDYNDPEYVDLMKSQLGELGWRQEVLRDFGGGGNSFVSTDILESLMKETSGIEPVRVLFPEWGNKTGRTKSADTVERGALYIWRNPVPGRDYIMGVDAGGGMGDANDNSAFEIIDAVTCEQVAEFYSNIVPAQHFAGIIAKVGSLYNTALVVAEDDKWGHAILDKLVHEFQYENIFYTSKNGSERVGVAPNSRTRPALMEALQSRLIGNSLPIRSRRLVYELKNFVYNPNTKSPEAARGHHDDAIMALAYALYARDNSHKYLPPGAIIDNPTDSSDRYKLEILERIKAELEREAPEEWFKVPEEASEDPFAVDWDAYYKPNQRNRIRMKRPHDSLLSELGM